MTVANNYAPVVTAANGVTTLFSGSWNAISASYLAVELLNTTTGVFTPVTQGAGASQYQVTTLTSSGFSITFNNAPASGNDVIISRSTTPQQTVPYTTSRGFQGSVEEGSFDILTTMLQELIYTGSNSLQVSVGDTAADLILPIVALREGRVLAFDASGNVIVSDQTLAQIESGSTSAAASATAAAASATSASTSATSASGSATAAAGSAAAAAASAAGFSLKGSCRVATTATLTAIYVNGVSGVGATLTNSSTLAALSIDGVALNANDRVLVKNQSTAFQNGIYTVTVVGSGAVAWVLTRATDYDEAAEILEGTAAVTEEGTSNAESLFIMTTIGGVTVGTTSITFTPLVASVGTNSVTNTQLAQMATNTIKGNATAGTANASDIAMAASTILARLASGNIVAATVAQILALLFGTTYNNVLGGDVTMTTQSTFYDGPSITVGGSGKYVAFGHVCIENSGNSTINAKLWDGTSIFDSANDSFSTTAGGDTKSLIVFGIITNPASNIIKISAQNVTNSGGTIKASKSGLGKDSQLWAFQIG